MLITWTYRHQTWHWHE